MNNGVVNNQTFHTFECFDGLYLNMCATGTKNKTKPKCTTPYFFSYMKR